MRASFKKKKLLGMGKYLVKGRILKAIRKCVSRKFCIRIKSREIIEPSRTFPLLLKSKQTLPNTSASVENT